MGLPEEEEEDDMKKIKSKDIDRRINHLKCLDQTASQHNQFQGPKGYNVQYLQKYQRSHIPDNLLLLKVLIMQLIHKLKPLLKLHTKLYDSQSKETLISQSKGPKFCKRDQSF